MDEIHVTFLDGPKVEIHGKSDADYRVEFIDTSTGLMVYQSTIKPGHWSRANPKYLMHWRIRVIRDGEVMFDKTTDYAGKKIFIEFGSKALGDTIAWLPIVEEFRKRHQAEVHVKTFWDDWASKSYPDLKFEQGKPGDYYAAFKIGAFDGDYDRNKNHWRTVPLQQIASDILGMEPMEVRPAVAKSSHCAPVNEKYVAISEFTTFLAKMWLYPGGWQEIADWLVELGYRVVSVSKEASNLKNITKFNGRTIEEATRAIQHADLFIGPSCGLSVLAWGLGVPVVMISGFSLPGREFYTGVERVINRSVCHGCGNDISLTYDRGNWRLCPRSKDFECSKSITPDMVRVAVKKMLRLSDKPRLRTMLITPHCSTGGGPQYLLKSVEELVTAGHQVSVVEWTDLSAHYVVQKNQIKNLCQLHTMNGNKRRTLAKLMEEFQPGVVHVQEFVERWMDGETIDFLYREDRDYRLVETTHSSERVDKRFIPDALALVSPLHFEHYGNLGIPLHLTEYPVMRRQRPPREDSLRRLGVDPTFQHVLHVGLFAPWKNQAEIFEIARRLPHYQFHFVGNQAVNFKSYWEPLMADKPDNCIIWGERADVDAFYAAMDLFLFPSTMECNPIVLKEALAWQMPIIMRNLPAYCGVYDKEPGVEYMDDNIELTCARVSRRLRSPYIGLTTIYERVSNEIQSRNPDRTQQAAAG